MNVSLHSKLLVSLLLVITITGVSAAIIGVAIIDREVVKQAQDKVRLDQDSRVIGFFDCDRCQGEGALAHKESVGRGR